MTWPRNCPGASQELSVAGVVGAAGVVGGAVVGRATGAGGAPSDEGFKDGGLEVKKAMHFTMVWRLRRRRSSQRRMSRGWWLPVTEVSRMGPPVTNF